MKHVKKIYEQFISESKDLAIEYAKELKSQGYNAISDDDTIEIEIDKNPFDKKFKDFVWTYTLYLSDGDFRVSGGIPGYTDTFGNLTRYGSGKWTGFKIKSVEDIVKAIKSPKGWNAKFNWGKWSSYWDIVLNKKSQYRQTKKGDLSRRDIKDMLDMWDGFKGAKLSKHPTTGSNIIIWDAYDWEYYWDGEDVWYGSIEKGKKFRYGSINSIEALKYMSDNLNPQQSDRSWEANENLDLGQIGGMGEVSLPTDGELGSGDVPAGQGDAEEEYKKKKKKMKHLKSFESFQDKTVNEITDYNDPVLIRLRQDKLRRADMAKLDALKKEAEKDRKKAMRRWNQKKYDQWLEDVAANDGWKNAYDMAQNAEFEPGLIDWVKKEFPYDDPMQRIQWDIEAFAESVVTESIINEKKLGREDMMKFVEKYMDFVRTTEEFNGSQGGIWVSGEDLDEYKGKRIYDYYSMDHKNRIFGVDKKWHNELEKRGWYSEWYDAGTVMIWEI